MAIFKGTSGDDINIFGSKGADIIDGLAGADTMTGLGGNDVYYVDNAGDKIVEVAGGGKDTVISSVNIALADNVENLTLTDLAGLGVGNTLNNIIIGTDAANYLDGGIGNDTLKGGKGDDTYVVDSSGDKVVETVTQALGGGIDKVYSSVDFSLAKFANVEELHLTGTGNLHATGNALDNVIEGNVGNNVLDGGKGADAMTGHDGNDTYYVDNAKDKVFEDKSEGTDTIISTIAFSNAIADVENYTFNTKTAVTFTGNDLDNIIHGGSGADTLSGGDGNDHINGGSGADTMMGGNGNDIYYVDNAGDKVVDSGPASDSDQITAAISFNLESQGTGIEYLVLAGTANLSATGNDLDNYLFGNDGANILDGGKGADHMAGGLGNDTFIVDNSGDVVTDVGPNGPGGIDTVKSSLDYTLGVGIENLTLTGTADHGTGNDLDNVITGDDGRNHLNGGIGDDTLIGGNGNDTYVVDSIGDKVVESANGGTDAVASSVDYSIAGSINVEDLFLIGTAIKATGNAADNYLTGTDGHNILDGGKGADLMEGHGGDDSYYVDNVGDKVNEINGTGDGIDTVYATISIDLMANVEDLQLLGTGALHGTGNAADNYVGGNDGANVLDGGAGMDLMIGQKGNDSLTGGTGSDTFYFNSAGAGNEGHDTITDFVKAEDVLSFTVGDVHQDGSIDIKDLNDIITSVFDHGAGKAVDVHFADGGEITFAGAGTGSISQIAQLVVDSSTQIHLN